MKPAVFLGVNGTLLGGPASTYGTELDVTDLPVYRGEGEIISCWRLSFADRLRALLFGQVWLRVAASRSHAPVCLDTAYPFVRPRLARLVAVIRRLAPALFVAWLLAVPVVLHACEPRGDADGKPEVLW